MRRIVISILLLVVVYAINGCNAAGQATDIPTATATPVVAAPTDVPGPTIASTQPTRFNPESTRVPNTPRPEIPPPIDTNPTRVVATVIPDPTLLNLVNQAKADLALRANVLPDEIKVKSVQAVEWRDASLGCPAPGEMYAQVITPGYLIVLEAAGQEWRYHTSTTTVIWCDR